MFCTTRDLTPAGTVEHCGRARFTRSDRWQLLVARSRVLEVYDYDDELGALGLEASFSLHGVVESICVVDGDQLNANASDLYAGAGTEDVNASISGNATDVPKCRDLVLLSFGTGRASLVAYSNQLGPHLLETRALFNFETEALGSNLRAESSGQYALYGYGARAICVLDPLARNAAMLVNGFQLAVMPLDRLSSEESDNATTAATSDDEGKTTKTNKANEMLREDQVADAEDRQIRLAKAVRRVAMATEDVYEMESGSFLIDLARLGIPAASVQHMNYLHKQNGLPVLAILHVGPIRSGTGRVVSNRWTTHLTAITVSRQDVTIVWKVRKLPHDSFAVIPMASGEVIVLSQNAIHHIVAGSLRRSVQLNGFAALTVDVDGVTDSQAPIEITLDGARWVWLDSFRLLLSLRYGQLVLVDIGPSGIRVEMQGLSNQASCFCLLDSQKLFLGSRLADSLLLSFKLLLDNTDASDINSLTVSSSTQSVDPASTLEEERLLYGQPEVDPRTEQLIVPANELSTSNEQWFQCKAITLTTTDALPCTGPITGFAIADHMADGIEAKRAQIAAQELQQQGQHSAAAKLIKQARERERARRKPRDIACSAGRARDGGLRLFCPGLRVDTTTDLICDTELSSNAQSMWVLSPFPNRSETYVFTCAWNNPGSFEVHESKSNNRDSNLNLLPPEATASLQISASPTVNMHASPNWIVQACLDRLMVLENTPPFNLIQEHELSIRSASFLGAYVIVILRSRESRLFQITKDGALNAIEDIPGIQGPDTPPAAAVSLFRYSPDPTVPGTLFCTIVRGGLNEVGAGAIEVYNVDRKTLVFRSESAIALGFSVVRHRTPTEELEPHKGLLAKVKVVSVCVAPVGRVDADPHCAAHLVPARLCVAVAMINGDLLMYRVDESARGDWKGLFRIQTDVVTRIDRSVLNRSRRRHVVQQEVFQEDEAVQVEAINEDKRSPRNGGEMDHREPRGRNDGYDDDHDRNRRTEKYDRDRDYDSRDIDRERGRGRGRGSDRDRGRGDDRSRERERERDRDRDRDRERSRGRDYNRENDRGYDQAHEDRDDLEGEDRKRQRSESFEGEEFEGAAEQAFQRGRQHDEFLGDGQPFRTNKSGYRSNPRLVAFDYLCGFCGIFLVSPQGTSVCIMGSRGFVTPVRLDIDPLRLWNLAVQRGKLMLLATSKAIAGATVLPSPRVLVLEGLKYMANLRLDAGGSFPFVQIPLQASVTKLAFEYKVRAYMMLCAEDDPAEEKALAVRSKCSIRLLCADTLAVTHRYSLMRHEKAINIVRVWLDMGQKRLKEFLAVGTGFVGPDGEDSGCKGRILLFAVLKDPEDGIKKMDLQLKIESRHIRGPVTAISSVDGQLLATFGTTPSSMRIFNYDPATEELVARSFIDTPFSAVSMKTIKNYILVGDLYRSVQMIHWHNFKREFRVVARDLQPLDVFDCEYVQHESALGIVVSDVDSNLLLHKVDSSKNTLVNSGEIHLGSPASQTTQVYVSPDSSIVVYSTMEGSLGSLVPLSEQVFRRLFALQAAMSSSPLVPRSAGLNPRAFRMARYRSPLQRQRQRNISDGSLLWSYLTLDAVSQRELARLIGTTPETIYQDLLDVDQILVQRAL